jgi:hypothetical protein
MKEIHMKKIENRFLIIGFASVLCLLLTAASVSAQIPPPTVTNTYAAKFICGVQPDGAITSMPDAQAGRYSTKINIHNNSGVNVRFRKKVIQLKGGQVPTEPSFRIIHGLRPDWAMEVTCRDIYSHLNIPIPPTTNQPPPYIEGFVILEVFFQLPSPVAIPRDPLDVAGIYTYRMEPVGTGGNSISVVVFPAKSNSYPLPPPPPVDDDATTTSRLAPTPVKP